MSAGPQESSPNRDAGISENSLLDGRVRLRQPLDGYRAAIDPVFLAAAVTAESGERLLDLGCGVGFNVTHEYRGTELPAVLLMELVHGLVIEVCL